MTPRIRKFLGTMIMVVFVTIYAFAAMLLSSALLPGTAWWVQTIYYAVAGLLWVVPAALLIRWMEKPA